MSLIGPLPYTIAPNTLADANQVQGNFASIVSQVNISTNVIVQGVASNMVNGVPTLMTIFGLPFNDVNSEISGNTFVPKTTGTYVVTGIVQVESKVGTTSISGTQINASLFIGGVQNQTSFNSAWAFADSLNRIVQFATFNTVNLTVGNIVDMRCTCNFAGTAPTAYFPLLNYRRIA